MAPRGMGPLRLPITLACLLALAVTTGPSCVKSKAHECGDILCPIGRACARDNVCVDVSVVSACNSAAEGDPCEVAEIGTGTCQGGLCLVGECGDGMVNAIDACDGKDLGGKTCLDFGSTDPEGLKCNDDCSFNTTGCTAICGDGVKNTNEECDGKDFDKKGCTDFGYYAGSIVCTDDCKVNVGGCSGRCGDGVVNGFEPCDGADFAGKTCQSLGYLGQVTPLTCTTACALAAESCTCGGVLCQKNTQTCQIVGGIAECQ